jgi:hypothetical protein
MKEKAIKEWKEKNIHHADFNFSCGGDSMNETELSFKDENDNVIEVSSEMESYIDREVYNNVSFYEASDGHYMGESGNVYIELDEEEEDFCFVKSAQSEWSETKTEEILIPISKEEKEFIDEYILSFGCDWSGEFVNYKKDLILSNEKLNILNGLKEKFDVGSNKIYGIFGGCDINDDSLTYTTDKDENDTFTFVVAENGDVNLVLFVSVEVFEFTDSND